MRRNKIFSKLISRDFAKRHDMLIGSVLISGSFILYASWEGFKENVVLNEFGESLMEYATPSVKLVTSSVFIAGISGAIIGKFYSRRQLERIIKIYKNTFDEKLNERIPERLKNLNDLGIVDAYNGFDARKTSNKIKSLQKGSHIRVVQFFITDEHTMLEALAEAIKTRDCTVDIIMPDPTDLLVIKKRAECLERTSSESFYYDILISIRKIQIMKKELPEDKRDNLSLRLHRSFISLSLLWIGDQILIGFYMNGKLASNGTILKVTGATKPFYQQITTHIETEMDKTDPIDIESYILPTDSPDFSIVK